MGQTYDVVVAGAGIIGLASALELQNRMPRAQIAVLEKEDQVASHQSSHNSGVIHAGVYYTPGSLKAEFCRQGVSDTQAFCDEHDVPYEKCGKLIVAAKAEELGRMTALLERARENGIEIEPVMQSELAGLEPNISGAGALLSPTTAIVDFGQVARRMAEIFISRGGEVITRCQFLTASETSKHITVETSKGTFVTGRLAACAGLMSDRVAKSMGADLDYQVIPFRGEFFRLKNQPADLVKHLIYPVPDPARPFLGVHLTRKMDGGFTVGPSAVMAFKREGYKLTDFSPGDLAETLAFPGFWKLLAKNASSAFNELASSASASVYLKKVQKYCPHLTLKDLAPYPAGVRAMAVGSDGQIIDDFLFHQTARSLHVCNAPSPAATSSIPIARHIADKLLGNNG